MELREYISIIVRWSWLIIVVTLSSIAIVGALSCFYLEKEFEATTTILIKSHKTENENGKIAFINSPPDENMIKVYTTLVQSDSVIDKTILNLNLSANTNEIRKQIKVEQFEETGIIKISVLDKSAQNAQDIVNSLLENLQKETQKINFSSEINIIDKAKFPLFPVKPTPTLNMFIAAVAGIMAGIILVVIIESLDNTLKSVKLLRNFSKIPLLAFIPKFQMNRIKGKNKNLIINIIKNNDESFKILRTCLNSICRDSSKKVIMITSPSFDEGKSIISVNLAATMGQLGKKVLLVDCDFRNTKIYQELDLFEKSGLSDYLADKKDVPVKINTISEASMHIVLSGIKPANPVELLESDKMKEFIINMREIYDMVIIDSPSILPVADAAILSKLVDGIVIVVKFRSTKYEMISNAVETLNILDANILGIVVNQITS